MEEAGVIQDGRSLRMASRAVNTKSCRTLLGLVLRCKVKTKTGCSLASTKQRLANSHI